MKATMNIHIYIFMKMKMEINVDEMKKKPTVQETRETQLIYHEFICNSIKFSFKCIDTKGTAKG